MIEMIVDIRSEDEKEEGVKSRVREEMDEDEEMLGKLGKIEMEKDIVEKIEIGGMIFLELRVVKELKRNGRKWISEEKLKILEKKRIEVIVKEIERNEEKGKMYIEMKERIGRKEKKEEGKNVS